jgi:MoaA/NifB/PqqE/SkfB family radical SAM enzyme
MNQENKVATTDQDSKLDPTFANQAANIDLTKAGAVANDIEPSPYWDARVEPYGRGGSVEFPLRTTVEKRILAINEILQLRSPEVRIEPTNLCNYTCVMCPRETHDRAKGFMPMEFYKSIVDEVILMGAKQITLVNFGEPFLDPTLEDKIHYASQKGLRTYIITNASLFHLPSRSEFAKQFDKKMTKIEAAVRAGLTECRLSFYGANKVKYEEIMVGGKFEQVEKNIQFLSSLRNNIGHEIVSPTNNVTLKSPEVSMYFLEFNEEGKSEEMQEFLEYTKDFADYIEVWKPHNFGAGRNYRETEDQAKPEKKSCGRPNSGPIQINWKGIVVPCCFDYNEEIPLGNVALQTVEEVVRGTAYEKLRESHNSGKFDMVPYCNDCDQLCERNDALIVSTNPKHQNRTKEDIMKSPNTLAGFTME